MSEQNQRYVSDYNYVFKKVRIKQRKKYLGPEIAQLVEWPTEKRGVVVSQIDVCDVISLCTTRAVLI